MNISSTAAVIASSWIWESPKPKLILYIRLNEDIILEHSDTDTLCWRWKSFKVLLLYLWRIGITQILNIVFCCGWGSLKSLYSVVWEKIQFGKADGEFHVTASQMSISDIRLSATQEKAILNFMEDGPLSLYISMLTQSFPIPSG